MEQPALNNAKVIRSFLDEGSSRRVETHEYMQFWQACSLEERQQFGNEARSLSATFQA